MEMCWVLRTGCSSDCEDNWPCKFECDKELMTCLGQCNWKDCGGTGTGLSTRPTVGMMQRTDAKMTFSYSVSTTKSPVTSRLTNKFFLVVNTNGNNKPMVLDYYGGAYRPTAITSCQLTRIGSLQFPFYWGGCANMGNRRIFLCFDQDNRKTCHYAEDPMGDYHKIYTSKYEHRV